MGFVFDSTEKGLGIVMKEYQVVSMRFLWERGEEGAISKDAWAYVNTILMEKEESISRASIINFLNDMVDEDVLSYSEKTGKGGYHRVYYPVYDEAGFKEFIAKLFIEKLLEEFPEETEEAILKIMDKNRTTKTLIDSLKERLRKKEDKGAGQAEAQGHPGPQT